jgi:hypothetical protein
MGTLTELRQLADDLTELGDTATAALVRQAIDRFSAWKFEAGERLLERALEERRKHEHEPPRSPYFNTCAVVSSSVYRGVDVAAYRSDGCHELMRA